MRKILTLKDDGIHPTIEEVAYVGMFITSSGLKFDPNSVLEIGATIDEGKYTITSIGTDVITVLGSDGTLHTVPLENVEWCASYGDFHVHLDLDEIDEYTSGYTDAIRDCVKYLVDSTSTIKKTLTKMGVYYLSDIDTDEKIAEFVSKRFEKKPQLTLDEVKEIVGYDFDLV